MDGSGKPEYLGVLDDDTVQKYEPDPNYDPKKPWNDWTNPVSGTPPLNGSQGKMSVLNKDGTIKYPPAPGPKPKP